MKLTRALWIAIGLLIAWFIFSWFFGQWIGLKPPALNYLRVGLSFLGLVGFIGYVMLRPKDATAPESGGADAAGDIDRNFSEANRRLQAAGGKRQAASLPAVFLIGDAGSAKTSVLAKSGLEPELLAGHVFQDAAILPTRGLNLWYARNTLFVDPSGALLTDPAARRKLFKKFLPVRVNPVAAAKVPPVRAIVLTVECDSFLQAGGADALAAKARQFQSVLADASQELGSSLPVYVLFTKADKIPYFRDYVENLTEAEASEVFGITLPLMAASGQGVYAEQQSRRVSEAFQDLYYTLAERRREYLAREHDAARLANIYEFPREFGKLRALLVQFLVDVCRPSQLGTSPFLRGFYFTGVRPVTVADIAPAAQVPVAGQDAAFDAGATQIFSRLPEAQRLVAEAREPGSRKIPQWVFLRHLFPEVVLADAPAGAVAQRNVKVNVARRALLGAVAALGVFLCVWWIISYRNNSRLIAGAVDAARGIPSVTLPPDQLAPLDSLQRLTRVKDTLATLDGYAKNGVPFSYDALLYAGDTIRAPLETTYFAYFRKLLLAPAQQTLAGICSKPEAYNAQGYRYVYDALKAYLITTDRHEKSTPEFLTPVLVQHWQQDQQVDAQRQDLARQNFDFYAQHLAVRNPYPKFAVPDAGAVASARAYLNKLPPEERIYQAMLVAAGSGAKPIIFNVDFPGSRETVINNYKVDPAFSKNGYANFARQLQDPEKYLYGESWVLGDQSFGNFDRRTVLSDITKRYNQEFEKAWQSYLNATSVVGYSSVPDAANKLQQIISPKSPLLEAFCVASDNTAANKQLPPQAFQPVQFVTPPGCFEKPLVGAGNSAYMQSLSTLQGALQAVGPIDRADPGNVAAANTAATQALTAVNTLSFSFAPDPADPKSTVLAKTSAILREPITRVPPLLKGAGAGPVNAAAGNLCASIAPMLKKYPFNSRASAEASLEEVNDFLKPNEGRLWQLYNTSLKQYLIPSGSDYAPAAGQQLSVTPAFLRFFNHAARMSEALYHGASAQPNLTFSMQVLPSQDVTHVSLMINGQTLSTDLKGGPKSQTFSWPGSTQGVSLGVVFGGGAELTVVQTTGLWALWRFLDSGERMQSPGNQLQVEWLVKSSAGQISTINGHPAAIRFALDSPNAQIFHPQYFGGLACTSRAVQ